MTGKEQFNELKKTMSFITKDGEWYRLIYLDTENNVCRFRKVERHSSSTDENTKTYEQACELYNIEIVENPPLPDQYFLMKIQETDTDIRRTVSNKRLISYLKEHKDECPDAVEKLREIVKTHTKYKVRKTAYKTCISIGLEGCEELRPYTEKQNSKRNHFSSDKSVIYNPPVGEFGFCCEEEKMAILFSHIKKKDMGDYKVFQTQFKNRYTHEAHLLNAAKMKKLYNKYYGYAMNGKLGRIQAERRTRINSELPKDILDVLKEHGLKVTRADGRGTSSQVKKYRRKKQYDQDRLSGYRIVSITSGTPIAGFKYELYEEDVRAFIEKLVNGEISLDDSGKER